MKSKCPECGSLIEASQNTCEKCGYIWFSESIYVDKTDIRKHNEIKDIKILKNIKELKNVKRLKNVKKLKSIKELKDIKNRIKNLLKKVVTKRNIYLTSALVLVILLFSYSIFRYLNKEDKYIFKNVYFGMSYYEILQTEELNIDEKSIDIYNGQIICKYNDIKIENINGTLRYCFSNKDKTLVKVIFSYKSNKEDNKDMKRYVKRHFGIGKEDDSIGYVRYGKTLNYYFTDGKCDEVEQVVVETKDKE